MTTTILTVNTGSSSVRLAIFARDDNAFTELARIRHDLSTDEPSDILKGFMRKHALTGIKVAVHRVVHGGMSLTASCLIDEKVEQEIERLTLLAPLHNPVALKCIRATREVLEDIIQVAVFDTAFFKDLPETARAYAIPHELAGKHGLRRYGFHGLAHKSMWQSWRSLQSGPFQSARIISMQLGAGCSITATDNGVPRDTSMGFSPLEGLVMATRSGDIDPGLAIFLQRQESLAPEQLDQLLNARSGLLGVSGISADMRELLQSTDPLARLAVDLYCYRARKYVGAYLAVLCGAEAIVFGGGVGENMPEVREKILTGMGWCGIEVDTQKNYSAKEMSCISSSSSRIEVWVIPVNEAVILAQEAEALMKPEAD